MTIKSNDDIVIMFESIDADMNGESIPYSTNGSNMIYPVQRPPDPTYLTLEAV